MQEWEPGQKRALVALGKALRGPIILSSMSGIGSCADRHAAQGEVCCDPLCSLMPAVVA